MTDPAGTHGHRRQSPIRRVGWWLRLGLVLAWAGLYGHHASEYLLLSLGLVERRDVSTIIQHHNRYRYRYDLLDASNHRVGNLFLEYQFVDTEWESSLVLDLESVDFLPGIGMVLAQLGEMPGRGVHLELSTYHDDRFRLSRIVAQGHVLGVEGSFDGRIDHTGLVGLATVPTFGYEQEIHRPTLLGSNLEAVGLDIAHALPPGLTPGDRFHTEVIAVDWTPPFLTRRPVVYRVVGREIADDGTELNLIEIVQDGTTMGELTATDQGVVRHTTHLATGLQLRLRTVFHNGIRFWPEPDHVRPDEATADDPASE